MNHAQDRARTDRRLKAAGFRPDDRAVSEVLGSALLVGITVALVSGLAIAVLSVDPPQDQLHADLSILVARGSDGVWGTGDEQLRIQHTGGEAIPADGLSIQLDIGGLVSTYSGAGLSGGAFDDGELTIGETWNTTVTVPIDVDVYVDMTLTAGKASTLITSSRVRAGGSCEPDTTAPVASNWDQTPADVTADHIGTVTITVTVTDACSGVDETVDPHLEYRINDGTDPAWTDVGAMSDAGTRMWTGTIPSQAYLGSLGSSLQYRVTGMEDLDNNTGTSAFQSDVIQFTGTDTYVAGHTDNEGTVSDFTNAQDDADGGAYATLTEAGSTPPSAYYATGATGSGGTGTASNAAGAPDDTYYILDGNNDAITVNTISTGAASGTITQVDLYFEGHYEGTRANDNVDLSADAGGGMTLVYDNYVPTAGGSGTDTQQNVDITGLLGSWTWTDVQNLELQAKYDKNGAEDAMDVHVDAMWVVVTISGGASMEIELSFPAVAGGTNVVELEYAVTGDTFHVEVWDGVSAWNTRGTTLDQSAMTIWVYPLTINEALNPPLIRIIDDSGGATQGSVKLDYVKVVSG